MTRLAAALLLLFGLGSAAGAQMAGESRWRVHVSAHANIFAAGRAQPADPGDGSGGVLPARIAFAAGTGNVFRIDAIGVTGCCGLGGAAWIPPDGAAAVGGGRTAVTGFDGIAGVSGDSQMALVGVFLADGAEAGPSLAALPPFTHREAPAETAPAIGQPFFIGDGRTGVGQGARQRFLAPPDASALYLGFADAAGFHGTPAAYTDNPGGLAAVVRLTPGNPGVLAEAGEALAFAGQSGEGRTAYADGLAFAGQSDTGQTAFAAALVFAGQAPLSLRADSQALVFEGQGGGPRIAQAPAPLRFTGRGDAAQTTQSMPLAFVGQGVQTRSVHAEPVMFVGQGQGCPRGAAREGAGEIRSLFLGGTDGWSIFGDAHGLTADADGLRVTDDATGEVWFWNAPARFLGCREAYYGGTLGFALRVDRTDAPFDDRDVVIVGADDTIWYDTGDNPGTGWTSYRIALDAGAGWRSGDGGAPANEKQIRAVLRDARALHIRGEYRTGDDVGWLRAVVLRPAEAPLAFTDETERQAIRLFDAVPRSDSSAFRADLVPRLEIDTATWDRTPYRVAPSFAGTVVLPPGGRAVLAGDAENAQPFGIDNLLLLEIGDNPPVVVGHVEPVLLAGRRLEQMGPNAFSFAAGSIDLTPLFAPGRPSEVRAMALDYGGVGYVSDVFLVIEADR